MIFAPQGKNNPVECGVFHQSLIFSRGFWGVVDFFSRKTHFLGGPKLEKKRVLAVFPYKSREKRVLGGPKLDAAGPKKTPLDAAAHFFSIFVGLCGFPVGFVGKNE